MTSVSDAGEAQVCWVRPSAGGGDTRFAEHGLRRIGMNENSGIRVRSENLAGDRGVVLLRCVGYIDTYNTSEFTRQVDSVIAAGASNLVFDLSKVSYASSTGIGGLVGLLKKAKQRGGDVVLVSPTAKVLDVLRLLGFASFFNIEGSLQEALQHFPQSGQVTKVPFETMEGITEAFGRLETLLPRDKLPQLYADIVGILKGVRELRAVSPSGRA